MNAREAYIKGFNTAMKLYKKVGAEQENKACEMAAWKEMQRIHAKYGDTCGTVAQADVRAAISGRISKEGKK